MLPVLLVHIVSLTSCTAEDFVGASQQERWWLQRLVRSPEFGPVGPSQWDAMGDGLLCVLGMPGSVLSTLLELVCCKEPVRLYFLRAGTLLRSVAGTIFAWRATRSKRNMRSRLVACTIESPRVESVDAKTLRRTCLFTKFIQYLIMFPVKD